MAAVPIVGLWVRAPGCENLQEMRQNLFVSQDFVREIPSTRTSLSAMKKLHPHLKAALVDDIDKFDDGFFEVTESEALFMDPQQRLLLQGMVHALEDSGITLEMVNKYQPAVYTASWCYDYKDLLPADQYLASGNSAATMCGRLSYFFNSRGASVGIETACSSSLVALHLARQSILLGESQMAIVCGANHIGARSFNSLYQSHMISPDGRSAPFDRSANGFVRAESFTSFALEHNLRVRCHVTGSAYNNDGRTQSLIAPNPVAQHEVQMTAMKDIDRHSVDVVTCHGTGTKLGDQVEITAINKSFKPDIRVVGPKSTLGHGEGSAGLIGVFQSVLLMQQETLPAQLHVTLPIELLEDKSFAFVSEEIEARRVAVSSYGFGGTNSSVVLDSVKHSDKAQSEPTLNILFLSAKSPKVLEELMKNYAVFLQNTDQSFSDILHTTNNRRTFYENRVAVIGKNREELLKNLLKGTVIKGQDEDKVNWIFGAAPLDLVSFRALLQIVPELSQSFDKQCESVTLLGHSNIRSAVYFPFRSSFSPSTLQVAELVAFISLFDCLEKFGALPRSVSGLGLAAIYAAAVSRIVNLSDALKLLADQSTDVKISQGRCLMLKGKNASKKWTREDLKLAMEKANINEESVLITVRQKKIENSNLLQLVPEYLATLFANGFNVRTHPNGNVVEVPAYPFEKMSFWPTEKCQLALKEVGAVGAFSKCRVQEEEKKDVDEYDVSSITRTIREIVMNYVESLESDDMDIVEGGVLDSLATIEMIEAIGLHFQLQMPFDILETAPSVTLLSEFVAETLQKTTSRLPKTEQKRTSTERMTEIGIVAADFKFSGEVTSFEDFWDALLTGRVLTKSMSEQRKELIGTGRDFQTGLLGWDVSCFDSGFFGISKDEAQFMDPQHRHLLHCAYNAWEKAGHPTLNNADLYLAVAAHSEYRTLAEKYVDDLDDRLWTGTNHSMMAGRLAQMLGIRGRALVVDSTCSSVASAMEMCISSMLRDGRDWGVVAATQLILSAPYIHSLRSLLPQDYTKSFSIEAAGFVRSEAVGIFILKRLEPLDRPLLIIDAAKAAHSGAVVTPVVASVAKLVEECGPVGYIEGHGTATVVGDGVEAMAYQSANRNDLLMASSKAQFGHSEAASGLLQICKVIKIMEEGTVPSILHNLLANEHIRNNQSLKLPYVTEERDVSTATMVSFGITGTKTAILGRRPAIVLDEIVFTEHILPLSAKTKEGLKKNISALQEILKSGSSSLMEVARALQKRETLHKWRAAIVAGCHTEAAMKLDTTLSVPPSTKNVLHVPTDAFNISDKAFSRSSEMFKTTYHSFCRRLRFEPFSDPASMKHRLATSYALLKCVQTMGVTVSQYAASGPACLLFLALFEMTADHYTNDLLIACLAGDIRQMKRNSRDLKLSLPAVKLLNSKGEQLKTASQFVEASFLVEEPIEFETGTIHVGGSKRNNFYTLHQYSDILQILSEQYVSGSEVNWSQFGQSLPKTPLAEYPYDMRSYWIPLKKTVQQPSNDVTVDLDRLEWSHVKDHVINGEAIVPGATSLRIIDQLNPRKSICSVDFLAPILPTSSKLLFETKNGAILSANGMDAVSFALKDSKESTATVGPVEMSRKTFETKEIYDRFSLSALMYQKRFQMLSRISASNGKGVAGLDHIDRLDILIDGALQTVAMGYLLEQPADHHPWLPFNVEQVKILNSQPKGQVTVYFTYVNNGSFLNGDASTFDADGNLLVDIKNVCFRRKEIEGRAAAPALTFQKKDVVIKRGFEASFAKAKNYVLNWFEESFGWDELDEKAGFFDFGLTSLQAVRLRNYLREEYPLASTTSVFDHPTILDLANYLASFDSPTKEKETEVAKVLAPVLPPSRLSQSPIGVRSAACRLPGGITDPADFWEFLLLGRNPSSRTPASRIASRNVLIKGHKYGSSVEGGNFIQQDVAAFDSSFFKISKSEAEMMDPQQRLLLECVEECIENSGDMDMAEVGVFVGLMEKEYADLMDQQQTTILSMLGSMVAVIAGRINYVFGSYGPSVTVDTACSSSLVAVEMAINALLDGRCRRAIVAGVNLILSEKGQGHRSNGKMLSAHGMSHSFDARASGYGRSDGCVVLILEKTKPTTRYLSTLKGVNVNHGGRSVSLTAPNGVAHKMLLSNLFATSPGVEASVWEAHGTGTSLGDPIEVNTLSSLLQDVVISSAKASLGHGEASAGTCGLLKLSLTLEHDYVPSLIHFHVLNKDIQPGTLRLPIVGEEKDFVVGGISSFGVSGTNAAVLAEKNVQVLSPSAPLHAHYILPLSAKTANSLSAFKESMLAFVYQSQEPLSDICGSIASRTQYAKRYALLVPRGKAVTLIEKSDKQPEFYLTGEELSFDLLAIEEINEYYEYLKRFEINYQKRLLLSIVKFLKNTVANFKWLSTNPKSHALVLLASGSLDVNDKTLRHLSGEIDPAFKDRLEFAPSTPSLSSISIGNTVTDLRSLLSILGELFVAGQDIDWTSVYSTPSRFIQLPTYPFNRQTIWFGERKPVYEHWLLGTEANRTEREVIFENQLSSMRHPIIFKNGFTVGDALLVATEAGRQAFGSTFKISDLVIEPSRPDQAVWLTVIVTKTDNVGRVIGKLGDVEVFSCILEPSDGPSSTPKIVPRGRGKVTFIEKIPSTVVAQFENCITVDAVHDCPYQSLFCVLEANGFSFNAIEINCLLPLEKKYTIVERDGILSVGSERGLYLQIQQKEIVRQPDVLHWKPVQMEVEQPLVSVKASSSLDDKNDVTKKLYEALNDVLSEGVAEGDPQGFMEMGMDSLTLVDFVNRLNERYFPSFEISTTDIFDHPSVKELAVHLQNIIGTPSIPEAALASDTRNKIKNALEDVLPDEPTDENQGFMEMGMDSLTLVDFVNRLNEKYFPLLDISTSDVFDHPTVEELTDHLNKLLGDKQIADEKQEEVVKPVAEMLLEKGKLEVVKSKVKLALTDVLIDEPEDFHIGFMEMGMDSLSLVDFVNRLNEKYFPQIEISTTDVFDHPTVLELSVCLLQKLGGDEKKEELNVLVDSGIGCSGEASPKREEAMLVDAFFPIEEQNLAIKSDYRMIGKNGKLLLVEDNAEFGVREVNLAGLPPKSAISIELIDGQLSSETLFLSLIDFCKLLAKQKKSVVVHVPSIFSSLQYQARAFMKTAAAEKPEVIKYVWTEQLQRKCINKLELNERLIGFWLISGGLSGIGLSTAKFLVEEGVEGVALISRRTPDDELSKDIDLMRTKATVMVFSSDITDKNKMRQELKNLKSLEGVIHCAGVLQDGKMERQNTSSFRKVFGPKADGLGVLIEVLDELNLRPKSFITASSWTSACGNVGQLNYGVANAYLDYKMAERTRNGLPSTTIHWGNWLETGMAANKNIHKILTEHGFVGFTTEEGLQYLKYAILKKPERMMAAKVDWNIILEKRNDIRRDLIKEGAEVPELETALYEFEVIETEKAMEEDSKEQALEELASMVQKLLKNKVKTNKSFMEMGFTSHTLSALLEDIKKTYKLKLTVSVFYEYPTLEELTEYILSLTERTVAVDTKEEEMYCDVLAMSISYDDEADFKKSKEDALNGRGTIRRTGKYLQHVQGTTQKEVTDKLSKLTYLEEGISPNGKLCMMFSGQGAQYPLMGAQLAESFPVFKTLFYGCLDECDQYLRGPISLQDILNKTENYKELLLTSHMQPIMFSFCYALGQFWKTIGLDPDFYLGHSVGELVAGVHAGIMTLEEGIELVVARGQAMEKINGRGAMLAVDSRAAEDVLKKFDVSIAAVNSPKQLVIAGRKDILDQALAFVKEKQLQATFVNTMYPFHSSLIIEDDLKGLRAVLKKIKFQKAKVPIVSNVTGQMITEFNEVYLIKHTVSAVQFVSCVEMLVKEGVRTYIEAGPSATLCQFLKRIIEPKEHKILQSIQDKGDECVKLVETAIELQKTVAAVAFEKLYITGDEDEVQLSTVSNAQKIELTNDEVVAIRDHKVNYEVLVPGMLQLYHLLKNVNQLSTTDFFTLTNVRFSSPWKLDQNRTAVVLKGNDNRLTVKINDKAICLAGLKQWNNQWKQVNCPEDFEGCKLNVDVDNWYHLSALAGLCYGPRFQVLKEVKRDKKKATAIGMIEDGAFLWPLMDGALHLICLIVQHRRPNEYYIPVSLNEVFIDWNHKLEAGQKVQFLAELTAENDKFFQFNSTVLIDNKLLFEARNVTAVVFKSEKDTKIPKGFEHRKETNGIAPEAELLNGDKRIPKTNGHSIGQVHNQLFEQESGYSGQKTTNEVIVVGSSGSFCFASEDNPSLWQQLLLGTSSHTYTHRSPHAYPNISLIDQDISHWDPEFFGVSPKEAAFIDPMQRLLMVMVYRALENANFPTLPPSTGVYVGQSGMDFVQMVYEDKKTKLSGFLAAGTHGSCISGRISHWLKLGGPSLVVDTACSSSFTALTLAAEDIRKGQVEMAIVSGVHLILHDKVTEVLTNGGMLSSFSKVFDASADGYRRSEGIGVVLLASKKYCKANGLPQLAKLSTWYKRHNGKSAAIQVPNGHAQEDCMRQSGDQVVEVELHATGTSLGDPIETSAVFRIGNTAVSSIKSHLGHAEGASGMASLLSVLLQLQHGYRLPQLHLSCPNPKIMELSTRTCGEEKQLDRIRINNFGFSGSLVSVTLDHIAPREKAIVLRKYYILPLSAKTKASLTEMMKETLDFLKHSDLSLFSLATIYQSRPQYRYRDSILVDYRRRTIKDNVDDFGTGNMLEFCYGKGVAEASGDLKSRIQTALHEAGTIFSPNKVMSPFQFYSLLNKEFLAGTNINWKAVDIFPTPPTNARSPGYKFNERRFWCMGEEKGGILETRNEDIYFTVQLQEKQLHEKKKRRRVMISSRINETSVSGITILFKPKASSYSEAVSLCQLWNSIEANQDIVIVVAVRSNGSSSMEWTGLIRSLAQEKCLSYVFVSYETERQLEGELESLDLFETVHWIEGRRLVERLEKITPTVSRETIKHLVISGGKGGIGREITHFLKPGETTVLCRSTGHHLSSTHCSGPLPREADLVVHAAGVVDNALMSHQDENKFQTVGDIKIHGYKTLFEQIDAPKRLLISSAAVILGSVGQANYAFANGRMVSLAEISGRPFRVVHYGPWKAVGMLSGSNLEGIRQQIQSRGWNFLIPKVAVRAVQMEDRNLMVFNGDFEKIVSNSPFLEKFLEKIVQRPGEVRRTERRQVTDLIKEISGLKDLSDEMNTPMMQLGMDSLMLEELRNRINQFFKVKISSADLYDNCTVAMVEKLIEKQMIVITTEKTKQTENVTKDGSIAIIGMSGSFSGAENIDEFWNNLLEGKESITRSEAEPGYVSAVGVAPNIDKFDHKFFKMTKDEADALDPQVRVFIQHVYNALEASGYVKERRALRIGVFAGAEPSDYSNGEEEPQGSLQRMFRSNMKDFLATMTAHTLDLNGPAVGIYSACSTSLLAIQQGVNALKLDQIDLAIAGGVSLALPSQSTYEYQSGMVLSKTGQCRPFDVNSDGTVRGSATGCLVLKPMSKAKEDNDHVLAVIRAVGTSNDGARKASFMAPNTAGQIQCIRNALEQLSCEDVDRIRYVESHGTATAVGDEIELVALREVYKKRLMLGSVKANIGHGFAGAGIASIFKVIKMLETRQVPPQINLLKPTEAAEGFEFASRAIPIPSGSLIAVSSFGIGGTNGHLVLEEGRSQIPVPQPSIPMVLPLSATSKALLKERKEKLRNYLKHYPDRLSSTAASLQHRREVFRYRSALVISKEIVIDTSDYQKLGEISSKNITFFFSPQGVQYANMEKELFNKKTVFSETVKKLCSIATRTTGTDFSRVMYSRSFEDEQLCMRPDLAQIVVLIINLATVAQLEHWEIQADCFIGHSVGEYAAFVCAGVLSEEDAIKLLYDRGKLCQSTPEAAMLAIKGDLPSLPEGVEVSAILSQKLHCVVGAKEPIDRLKIQLDRAQQEFRELQTERGFHSSMLDTVLDHFEKLAGSYSYKRPNTTVISGMDGRKLTSVTAEYLKDHMRQSVNLKESFKVLFANPDIKVVVEIGPSGVLRGILRENYPEILPVNTIPSKRKSRSGSLANSLAELWSLGYPIDWSRIYSLEGNDPFCPPYNFEKTICWKERLPSEGHKFFTVSWIPVASQPTEALCVLVSNRDKIPEAISSEQFIKLERSADTVVYAPSQEDNVFSTVQSLLETSLRLNVTRFITLSNGNHHDWLSLGPIRELQLAKTSLKCQFVWNPDNLTVEESLEKIPSSQEQFVTIGPSQSYRLGYSELCESYSALKIQGVVVIFGGSGAIGSAYVTVLKTYEAVEKIIVVGRREDCGLRDIDYRKADITSDSEVDELLFSILEKQKRLDVVINLAGVVTSSSLKKTSIDIGKVLATKVHGTENILRFFEEQKLTLPVLILSSSLSSYLPIQGNSDYASANAYLDGLAVKGHKYVNRIQTIQWPLWKQGSMATGTSDTMGRLLGRGSLSLPQGLKAIKESFGMSGCLAYSFVHPEKLKKLVLKEQLEIGRPQGFKLKLDGMEEVRLAWKEVLSSEIEKDSNFFDLGGNSLNGLGLVWKLNQSLGTQLSVNYIFSHPVFSDFYENLPKPEQKSNQKLDVLSPIPLSFAQENMFLLKELDPGPQYNIIFAVDFGVGSKVDRNAMIMAVRFLIARQLGMRTVFQRNGNQFSQEILSLTESYHSLAVRMMGEEEYEDHLRREKTRIFDFGAVPLIIEWIETPSGKKLLFNQHHILTDGWSMSVLATELSQLYKCALENQDAEPLKDNLSQFAIANRNQSFEENLLELKAKYKNPGKTVVLRDNPTSRDGFGSVVRYIPTQLVTRIRSLAKSFKTTDFVVCLSAYLLTLRRWKSQLDEDHLVVGIPVSGRDEQSKDLIGYFLNNLVLMIDLKLDIQLEECSQLVEKKLSEARRTEHIPFFKLVAALGLDRTNKDHPVFQMYFNYRHTLDYPRVEIEEQECVMRQVTSNTLFDLSTTIDETPEGLRVMLDYNCRFYEKATVERFAADIMKSLLDRKTCKELCGGRMDNPKQIPCKQLRYSGGASNLNRLGIDQKFMEDLGIPPRPDSIVVLELSPNTTARLIPVLLSHGMAFAPVDPSWPDARKDAIRSQIDLSFWIDEDRLSRILLRSKRILPIRSHPHDLAYIIHTSGSTGTPKGVAVSHKNLNCFLTTAIRQMLLNTRSVVYNSVNTVFDVSVSNILGAASTGAQLFLHGDLKNQIEEARHCSYVFLTSAVFNSLSDSQINSLSTVESLFVGGETIQDGILLEALKIGLDVTQIYGPTEGTIWSLTNRCKLADGVGSLIGRPMSSETAKVSGDGLHGELVLSGNKVARGYLGGEKFSGVYPTRDLVRLKRDSLIYLERMDEQVKIRGNRIELKEVEHQTLTVSKARSVIILKDQETLIAFLLSPIEADPSQLKVSLSQLLPAYSIPSAFISVQKLPRNSNGKIDKSKLLQEYHSKMRRVPSQETAEDRDIVNSIEQKMFAVFAKTLKQKVTNLNESFFSLGGHSLLLLTLQQNIKEYFDVDVSVSDLFSNPTVAGAASLVVKELKTRLSQTDISIITKLREASSPKANLYLIHAVGGAIFPYYAFLQIFPKNVSIYAIEYQLEYKAETLKELAALYAKTVVAHTKNTRPFVLGHSMGGTVSREMVPDLKMWGWEIPFVVMFDSWVLRPKHLKVEKIRQFMETVFAPLPNAATRVEKAVKLAVMLKDHRVTKSKTKLFLFKSKHLGEAAFRDAVRPDLNEAVSRGLVANGFERVSHLPVTTWMIDGDHESCLKLENLKTRQKEVLSIFHAHF